MSRCSNLHTHSIFLQYFNLFFNNQMTLLRRLIFPAESGRNILSGSQRSLGNEVKFSREVDPESPSEATVLGG